ncbi:hypothetical protein BS17DRAFT_768702 [Gyrodon lividus]|nr:hypothetical protein BS17DRAFT_768702 [Gyrodon lividus]
MPSFLFPLLPPTLLFMTILIDLASSVEVVRVASVSSEGDPISATAMHARPWGSSSSAFRESGSRRFEYSCCQPRRPNVTRILAGILDYMAQAAYTPAALGLGTSTSVSMNVMFAEVELDIMDPG